MEAQAVQTVELAITLLKALLAPYLAQLVSIFAFKTLVKLYIIRSYFLRRRRL